MKIGEKRREQVKRLWSREEVEVLRRLMFWNASVERVGVIKINFPPVCQLRTGGSSPEKKKSKTAQWLVYAFPK